MPLKQNISHYEIIEKLGEGGMGEVYKARDVMLDRIVAIKMLPDSLKSDPDKIQRFSQEAKAASALDHPNICTIYEIDDTGDGQMFIVMAHYEGETLKEKIGKGALPIVEAVKIAAQVAEGLSKAHRQGIVHRDIKPANIIVTNDGLVKILDFGLAKISGHDLTKTDTSMGTLGYASPEQLKGDNVDQRTDIWSLGVVLYELLTGKQPFAKTEHPEAIYFSIMNEVPENAAAINAAIPESLQTVIDNALAKAPEDRYQKMDDMLADLNSVQAEMSAELKYSQVMRLRRKGISKSTLIASFVVLLFLIAGLLYIFNTNKPTRHTNRIAVLPIANFSNNPENDYIADGMTEELISKLSRINELNVIARTSVMKFKDATKTIAEIGKELNVAKILEGSIRSEGEDLRFNIQLINVEDEVQMWSNNYNRTSDEIFPIQNDIAQHVSEALKIQLAESEQQRVDANGTDDPEAYKLYLQGLLQLNKHSEEAYLKARDFFIRSIESDPLFARAHAGLSDSYYGLSNLAIPAKEAMPKARAAAQRALQIDSTLAEAHSAIAKVFIFYDWDWQRGERALQKAISLNPNYADAYQRYGMFLCFHGRFNEAKIMFDRAKSLNPLSSSVALTSVYPDFFSGEYEKCLQQLRAIIKIWPDFFPAYGVSGWVYGQQQNFTRAIEATTKTYELSNKSSFVLGNLGHIYAISGKRKEAMAVLDTLYMQLENVGHIQSSIMAQLYIGLGDKDSAFEWLEKAYFSRDEELIQINVHPHYDPLRSDPRFTDLLKKMGFEQ